MSPQKGFSLLELLIALVLLSILTAIAYPSYLNYRMKVHRVDGKTALHTLAMQMERYFTEHHTYKDATLEGLGVAPLSEGGLYNLKLNIDANGTSYLLEAVPTASQTNDTECGTFSLDHQGKKKISGTGSVQNCW